MLDALSPFLPNANNHDANNGVAIGIRGLGGHGTASLKSIGALTISTAAACVNWKSELGVPWRSRKGNDVADVRHAGNELNGSLQAQPETSMRHRPVST